jgi:hypothetical protein
MSVTVAAFLSRIAKDLHEDPATFPPGDNNLWTLDELVGYISYAERDFLRRTGVEAVDVTIPVAAGNVLVFSKPNNMMDIDRVSFNYKRLRRVTSWDLEREDPTWRTHPNHSAQQYHEDHLPINSFELDNRQLAGGNLRVFGGILPPLHTTNTAELIAVKDCWEQYIRWEVLSLALGKDGDNQDVARSAYAHQRYLLGCSLAKRMVLGTAVEMGGVLPNA